MKLSYPGFFQAAASGAPEPYDWQRRLAEDPACQSRLIDIPTGLGKTAGVVLAWLSIRETVLNPPFNSGGFATIKSQAGLNNA